MSKRNYEMINRCINRGSLELLQIIDGVSYYHQGSDEATIIAVDHLNKLAVRTTFFEIEDFLPVKVRGKNYTVKSDYAYVEFNGELIMNFEKHSKESNQ